MQASIPAEVENLAAIIERLASFTNPDEWMQHHASFQSAHEALRRECDDAKRRRLMTCIARAMPRSGPGRVMTLSFLVAASCDPRRLWELHRTLLQPEFTLEQRHFFYWQLIIRHAGVEGRPHVDPAAVYFSLLESCRTTLGINAQWIDAKDRDAGTVVVITNQLLGRRHAPTADCLDYCHILQNRLKKRVFLINTGAMPWRLPLPYYDPVAFQHVDEYAAGNKLPFRDEEFDFYQCRQPMPNLEELRRILATVLSVKPSFILSLGHSNIAPDLCSEFLTVATMPFGTNLSRAASNVFLLPRECRPDDAAFMQQWRIAEEQVVETHYTFRRPDRTAVVTRSDLGLPQDAYVIAVVGNRLDEEVDDRFAAELSRVLTGAPQVFVVFMGQFGRFEAVVQQHEALRGRSRHLGYRKDVPAVYECCDAYLNPPRYGGGSSAAFALAAGLPVFTPAEGDVANIVGPRFIFPSAEAIIAHIERSLSDPEHRRSWAELARKRFTEISDREEMIEGIVANVEEKLDIRNRRRAPRES